MATVFYKCPICGNVIMKVEDGGPVPHCCGQEMTRLEPKTMDPSDNMGGKDTGLTEKHVPTIERLNDCTVRVCVGSNPHPMTQLHHICFIWLETECGGQLRYLSPCEQKIAMESCTKKSGCKVDMDKNKDMEMARNMDMNRNMEMDKDMDKEEKTWQACAEFCCCKDRITAVYEYCNLHGLWKMEVSKNDKCNKDCCK